MAIKYKIVYDDYSQYKKRGNNKTFARHLIPVLLSIAIVLFIVCVPGRNKLFDLFLPGDPSITTEAFCQLAESLDRGDALLDALDAFCNTVMDVR